MRTLDLATDSGRVDSCSNASGPESVVEYAILIAYLEPLSGSSCRTAPQSTIARSFKS